MKSSNRKRGFALLTVMFIIAALGVSVGILARIGQQRIFDAKRQTNRVKALAYAEAGIDFAYAIISTDFDTRNNPSAFSLDTNGDTEGGVTLSSTGSAVKNSYGDGSFALSLTPISNRYVIVNSVGHCNGVDVTTEVLVEDIYAGSGGSDAPNYSDMEGFKYAILCGGDFDFSGCGTISSPSGQSLFHANGQMFVRGNTHPNIDLSSSTYINLKKLTVGGNVIAPSVDMHKQTKILGTLSTPSSVPQVQIPDIDLTPYYTEALKNGEVYNGFTTTSDLNPKGGIMWVEGDFHISAHATINGSVIATGDINLSGQIDITPTKYAFSVASRDGDIHVTSGGTIKGLMYAKTGELQHTANGEIIGQVIINGNIKKAGNSDIMTGYAQNIPTPPTSTSTPTKSLPLIAGWQK